MKDIEVIKENSISIEAPKQDDKAFIEALSDEYIQAIDTHDADGLAISAGDVMEFALEIIAYARKSDDRLKNQMLLSIANTGNIEALERYIALKEREEARQGALAFDAHFAVMQAELGTVARGKQGHGYMYAALEDLQRQCGPTIATHGFSYSWREDAIEGGKRVIMTISGHGHSRETSFDVPGLTGTQRMNAVQVAGAMSTYGRRYTFIAGFGIVIDDEDRDGIPVGTGETQADNVLRLQNCHSIDDLMTEWRAVFDEVKDTKGALEYLTPIKDEMKRKLS